MDKSLAITLGCILPLALGVAVLCTYVLIQTIQRNRRTFRELLEKQEEDNLARGAVFGLDAHPNRKDLLKGYKSQLDFAPRIIHHDSITSILVESPNPALSPQSKSKLHDAPSTKSPSSNRTSPNLKPT